MSAHQPGPAGHDRVREARLRDLERSRLVVPVLVRGFRRGGDPVELADEVANRYGLDSLQAYRWAGTVFEQLERSRRRFAGIFMAAMWSGAAALIVVVAGVIVGRIPRGTSGIPAILIADFAAAMVIVGIVGGLYSRKLARRPGR